MPCSDARSTDRWSASPSRMERSDNSYNAAPGRRTWRINLSLHYLSDCINKKSDIVFRRFRQNAVTQTANPTGRLRSRHRLKKRAQVSLEFAALAQQQRLIEVPLDEATRK